MSYGGRVLLEMRHRTHLLRKNEKDFSFFSKIACFSSSTSQKSSKILLETSRRKKIHSVSERSDDGLSSHAFISISTFLTKIDFFEGGRP